MKRIDRTNDRSSRNSIESNDLCLEKFQGSIELNVCELSVPSIVSNFTVKQIEFYQTDNVIELPRGKFNGEVNIF